VCGGGGEGDCRMCYTRSTLQERWDDAFLFCFRGVSFESETEKEEEEADKTVEHRERKDDDICVRRPCCWATM
jgi:hypothetical protein